MFAIIIETIKRRSTGEIKKTTNGDFNTAGGHMLNDVCRTGCGCIRRWRYRIRTRLLGDASDDSPVVDEGSEGQFFGAAMAVYSF